MTTASTDGARSHARSQAAAAAMRVPAVPDGVDDTRLVWSESVPAESYATRVLGRGLVINLSGSGRLARGRRGSRRWRRPSWPPRRR